MAFLPDELILEILSFLDPRSLRFFGYTSKSSFAFSRHEDLWKSLFLYLHKSGQVDWRGTWLRTVLRLNAEQEARINCENVLSEILVQPYLNATIDLSRFERIKDSIPRFKSMDSEEFCGGWYAKPFILTDIVSKWPAYTKWGIEYLLSQFPSGDATFQIESVEWSLPTYIQYMSSNRDESPLYLFDKDFATKPTGNGIPLEEDYLIPETFKEDLFTLLGKARPDHRWLIVGPTRSGSTFHKDPNATSAWNAVISGSKLWILFPPHITPPGVYVNQGIPIRRYANLDESEVTSPISIADWLRDFYPIAAKHPSCIRGVCHAGEVMYIPSGWWHLVVNLSESIAVTQNFVPPAHLKSVLKFLKDKQDQISGFSQDVDAYELFRERLEVEYPELLATADAEMAKSKPKKRKWVENAESSEFSFNFFT